MAGMTEKHRLTDNNLNVPALIAEHPQVPDLA